MGFRLSLLAISNAKVIKNSHFKKYYALFFPIFAGENHSFSSFLYKKSPERMHFKLEAPYQPAGDQPAAIDGLCRALTEGVDAVTLLGVTGSGKTFTMANVIQRLQRPALILSHNKTLAAQLYGEFKTFFPHNAVEYFVSYYDYYQPEAYIPSTDTYIEKDLSINEQIDKLRLSAASALHARDGRGGGASRVVGRHRDGERVRPERDLVCRDLWRIERRQHSR